MSETIQVQIDDQGDMVIPAEIRERLGVTQGMTFIAQVGEQGQLRLRVEPKSSEPRGRLTVRQLRQSGLIGLWKDRADIQDSSVYARQLREQAQGRLR